VITVAMSRQTVKRPSVRSGLWRAVVTLPALVGSALLMLVMFGWAGGWEPVLMLTWLASGVAVLTPPGERTAVRFACGFRPLSAREQALLGPPWQAVLERCNVPADSVDLYVQRAREPNAYAAGGRSVAVTTGVAADFLAQTLTHAELSGLLAHELGHHSHRATRFALVTVWLATPWRIASRVVLRLGLAFSDRQPRRLLVVVAIATVVVAVLQSLHRHQLAAAAVILVLAICGSACPLAEAALSRRAVGRRPVRGRYGVRS
jgi:STE24 endopeptidase